MCRESGPAVPDMLLPESDEIWMNVGRFEQQKNRVWCRERVSGPSGFVPQGCT